ncbi:MAG TPA: penicillin-binding protein 2 [Chthoniobacterales bacterium]
MKFAGCLFLLLTAAASAQETVLDNTGVVENPKPTWETQKQARTFQLDIPAPRGQITDRNGRPLAQNRLSYNLAITFPSADWTDEKALAFAIQQITLAKSLLGRDIPINQEALRLHYKNRSLLPFDLIEDLTPQELNIVARGLTPNLILRQSYARIYPEKNLAGHLIGYVGRVAPLSTRPIENKDLIFPDSEGREGIEQIFNDQLRGQNGQLYMTFDADGKKMSERIGRPPVPGNNIITTIDQPLQKICENVLAKNCKRGAIVIIEPSTGEILAMASWPNYDLNTFVPVLKGDAFKALQDDPDVPLLPRAFRSAYPPGSTFKTFVGLAGLQSGAIKPATEFGCPTSLAVGNFVFSNWKKVDAGRLTFVKALEQSCNTWFYQAGIKTGAPAIIDWTTRLGLGRRTGIPLNAEEKGNIPTDEYMQRVHKRRILKGDVANMSIGQGDILITPLQMAQAMSVIAMNGQFHQIRLVKQVQALDNSVVAAYPDRLRAELPITPEIMDTLRKALVLVTEGGNGTAHRAQVKGMPVAGKTGTAQWGPAGKQRTAAWFTGFLPADNPQFAFAALYEGDAEDDSVHGGSHAAPLIGKVFKEYFALKKGEEKPKEDAKDGEAEKSEEEMPADESN